MKKSLAHIGRIWPCICLLINLMVSAAIWWAVVIEGIGSAVPASHSRRHPWFLINVLFALAVIDDGING